ncbi:MAG: FixH family protein [Bacteroidetes bacterium]|nr:FixH family protein [Bacteroidota bacterium]
MKWNWGTGIFLVIVIFLTACTAFIIYSLNQRWSLVEEDYYPKELRHEEQLVKMRNVNELTGKLLITLDKNNLTIQFPDDFRGKPLTGKIDVYRPSDETRDVVIPVSVDSAQCMYIPVSKFIHGKYIVKADWISGGKGFYQETSLFIP